MQFRHQIFPPLGDCRELLCLSCGIWNLYLMLYDPSEDLIVDARVGVHDSLEAAALDRSLSDEWDDLDDGDFYHQFGEPVSCQPVMPLPNLS